MANKAVALIIALILIVVIVYFVVLRGGLLTSTTSTLTTILTSQGTTSTTTATTTTATTSIPAGSCVSPDQNVSIYNGDFSTGTFAGWNVTGPGFGSGPLNITYANQNFGYYNHTWVGYIGNFFASTFHGGIGVQGGNLTSNPFEATEPYLNFRIISPENNQLYVEVLQGSTPIVITHFNTYLAPNNKYPTSQFINASIPLTTALCQNVSVKIIATVVGGMTNSKQYIAVGDFYMGRVPTAAPGIIVNQSIT